MYDEYYESREVSDRGRGFLQWWHSRLLDQVFSEAGIPRKLLEVGSGWGFIGAAATERGVEYRGIELSDRQTERLREDGLNVVQAQVPPYPAGPAVDMIYAAHLIEHFPTWSDAEEFVSQSRDRLEPGGTLVIVAPDVLSWRGRFWDADWSHGYPTTLRRVQQLLHETGMRVEYAAYAGGGQFGMFAPTLASFFASLVPVALGDWITRVALGRPYWYSFMGTLGWRQIIVIGRKPKVGTRVGID